MIWILTDIINDRAISNPYILLAFALQCIVKVCGCLLKLRISFCQSKLLHDDNIFLIDRCDKNPWYAHLRFPRMLVQTTIVFLMVRLHNKDNTPSLCVNM